MFNRNKCYHFCAIHSIDDGGADYLHGVIQSRISPFEPGFYDSIRSLIADNMDDPCSPRDLIVLSLTRIY